MRWKWKQVLWQVGLMDGGVGSAERNGRVGGR
jgi:hypothetical protein